MLRSGVRSTLEATSPEAPELPFWARGPRAVDLPKLARPLSFSAARPPVAPALLHLIALLIACQRWRIRRGTLKAQPLVRLLALTSASFVQPYTMGSLPSHCCEEERWTLVVRCVMVVGCGVPAPSGSPSHSVGFPAFCLAPAEALLSGLARQSVRLAHEAVPPLTSGDGKQGIDAGSRPSQVALSRLSLCQVSSMASSALVRHAPSEHHEALLEKAALGGAAPLLPPLALSLSSFYRDLHG